MPKNIKILITTGIFPPDIGGPATQIERLAADLSQSGFEVSVLTYGAPEKKARLFKLSAVSRRWPVPWRQILFGLKTFFLARQADIIYTMDLYSSGFHSMLASKFWRKKFIVRFAGDSAWEIAQNSGATQDDISVFQEKTYSSFIEKRKAQRSKILKSADAIVAVSNFMGKLALKIGGQEEKIHVLYNAVDFLPSPPPRQKPDVPTLVFASRLAPWKGVWMLIKVVAKLKQKYPDIVFEILGEGPQMQKLKELSQSLGVENNVRFRGRVSEEESHKIFSQATIFVLNTNYEGLPHSVLNALRVGIPVITTPAGGNPEVIQSGLNGFLTNYNNEQEWIDAIEKLLKDEKLQSQFVARGKETLDKFKWSELLKNTIAVFNKIL